MSSSLQPHAPGPAWGFLAHDVSAPALPLAAGKILVVDSCAANRQSVREALSGLEHEILEAQTTSEAIAAISLYHLDLVIVDLSVPEIGGVEFCRMLKKAGATRFLPVFISTASDDLENEVVAIEAGADAFLIQPMRLKAFRARVQASLRHKAMIESIDDSETVLFSLAQSVEERDPALGQHCQRLALMASAMGVALGLPAHDVYTLQRGGYLHDIGKVAIPDRILFKAGPLTFEEWQVMQSHAERGERICANMRSLAPVLPIIRHHHEKWNGTGYPDGLRGDQIPLLARLVQVADIFDALTTARPYKAALPTGEAIAVLCDEARRGWRDPKLVELFADILPSFQSHLPGDLSHISLHALAASIDRYRTGVHIPERQGLLEPAGRRNGKVRAL
jgi:putative two-component system response regulator